MKKRDLVVLLNPDETIMINFNYPSLLAFLLNFFHVSFLFFSCDLFPSMSLILAKQIQKHIYLKYI